MPQIKLKHARVKHPDPKAAGFDEGWRWRTETPHGPAESFAATRKDAEAAARRALLPVTTDIEVVDE
jgi:hypothetical protein